MSASRRKRTSGSLNVSDKCRCPLLTLLLIRRRRMRVQQAPERRRLAPSAATVSFRKNDERGIQNHPEPRIDKAQVELTLAWITRDVLSNSRTIKTEAQKKYPQPDCEPARERYAEFGHSLSPNTPNESIRFGLRTFKRPLQRRMSAMGR